MSQTDGESETRQGCPLATLPARALPSKAANKAVNRTPSAPVTFSVRVSEGLVWKRTQKIAALSVFSGMKPMNSSRSTTTQSCRCGRNWFGLFQLDATSMMGIKGGQDRVLRRFDFSWRIPVNASSSASSSGELRRRITYLTSIQLAPGP